VVEMKVVEMKVVEIVKIIPISESTEFDIVLILKDTKSSHVTNP
jgi:hypothetical protein